MLELIGQTIHQFKPKRCRALNVRLKKSHANWIFIWHSNPSFGCGVPANRKFGGR